MTERIALGNNFTNEKHIELYKMWGAGDIGILLTGNVQVHRDNLEGPANVAIEEDTYKEQMPMLKNGQRLQLKKVADFGCKFLMLEDKLQVRST